MASDLLERMNGIVGLKIRKEERTLEAINSAFEGSQSRMPNRAGQMGKENSRKSRRNGDEVTYVEHDSANHVEDGTLQGLNFGVLGDSCTLQSHVSRGEDSYNKSKDLRKTWEPQAEGRDRSNKGKHVESGSAMFQMLFLRLQHIKENGARGGFGLQGEAG